MSEWWDGLHRRLLWEDGEAIIYPLTTFTFRRNLSYQLFSHELSEAQKRMQLTFFRDKFAADHFFSTFRFFDFTELSLEKQKFLLESFFVDPVPLGVGALVGPSLSCMIHFCSTDHLVLQALHTKGNFAEVWKKGLEMSQKLTTLFPLAHSSRYGYLTAAIDACGLGLDIHMYLHLPALRSRNEGEGVFKTYLEQGISAVPLFDGDLVRLEGKCHLRLSEQQLMQALFASAGRLSSAEKKVRAELKARPSTQLQDRIHRSLGLLLYTMTLTPQELLTHLSMVKLGLDLGWLQGMSDAEINALFVKTRLGHLAYQNPELLENEEKLALARAALVREHLSRVK